MLRFFQWPKKTSICVMRNWKIHRTRSKFCCGQAITSKICSSCLRYSVAFCGHLVRAGRMVVTISFVSSSIIQGEPKNTEPIKMLINPTSSNLVDLNFSLWMIFPQSFSHLSQFAYNLYVLSKMCSKWHPRR